MAFNNYSSINDVIDKHRIRCVAGAVIEAALDAPTFNDYFQSELAFNIQEFPLDHSEGWNGELLLFPILREVWKPYRTDLSLFSHEPFEFDDDLCGTPDYFVCKRSEFGPFYPTVPYLLVVEAKLDNFGKAWGQCLAAMLATQKLNATPDKPVYGIATNGRLWEFGVLLGNVFTRDQNSIALFNLDSLRQALHGVFRACRDMGLAHGLTPAKP
jgi:hypothetical protein